MPKTSKRTRTTSVSGKDPHSVNKKTKNSERTAHDLSDPIRKNSKDSHGTHDSGIDVKTPKPHEENMNDVMEEGSDPESPFQMSESAAQQLKHDPVLERHHGVLSGHTLVNQRPMDWLGHPSRLPSVQNTKPVGKFSLSKHWEESRYPQQKDRPVIKTEDQYRGPDAAMQRLQTFRRSGHIIPGFENDGYRFIGGQCHPGARSHSRKAMFFDDEPESHRLTIEDAHIVTLPRTMEDPEEDEQVYDSFTQGIAIHSNNLRYHVRSLEREDVGREEYAENSGNMWY